MNEVLSKFKFVAREVVIEEVWQGELEKERVAIIGLLNTETDVIVPHPLTNFIKKHYRYRGMSLSAQMNPAREVCKFLNFIYQKINEGEESFVALKKEGLGGLKRVHGSLYITEKTLDGLKYNTVKQIERYLVKFYSFLKDHALIEEDFEFEIQENQLKNHGYSSLFNQEDLLTRYPSKRGYSEGKLKDFGVNRYQLVVEFIEIAKANYPEIALGLCFQFFGGLRCGEVVNLTINSIKPRPSGSFGDKGIVVEVRDNQPVLFSHLKDTSKENVKNERNQTLLNSPYLRDTYKQHLQWLEKNEKTKDNKALFISKRTGKALSGAMYQEKFNAVKDEFVKQLLKKRRFEDYEFLTSATWSTHIGRGVFTNFLIDMKASIQEIAIARGDSNFNSAMSYVEEKNALRNLEEALEIISDAHKNQLADISVERINKWKDVSHFG